MKYLFFVNAKKWLIIIAEGTQMIEKNMSLDCEKKNDKMTVAMINRKKKYRNEKLLTFSEKEVLNMWMNENKTRIAV